MRSQHTCNWENALSNLVDQSDTDLIFTLTLIYCLYTSWNRNEDPSSYNTVFILPKWKLCCLWCYFCCCRRHCYCWWRIRHRYPVRGKNYYRKWGTQWMIYRLYTPVVVENQKFAGGTHLLRTVYALLSTFKIQVGELFRTSVDRCYWMCTEVGAFSIGWIPIDELTRIDVHTSVRMAWKTAVSSLCWIFKICVSFIVLLAIADLNRSF